MQIFAASPQYNRVPSWSPWVAVGACVLLVGCREQDVTQQAGHSRLASIASAYGKYQVAHRGQLPPNEETFREFLAGHHSLSQLLKTAGVSAVDELFVSERDQQPYVLLFGAEANKFEGGIMGYEQRGVNGQRIVGYRAGYVNVIDEAQFREITGRP